MQEIDIKSWLSRKVIFVTGATGFLGKVLVEKLLRECENVTKVYILIRAGDNLELIKRFNDFRKNQVFNRIIEFNPYLLDKLHPIQGDLSKLNIGLSEMDRSRLIKEVDVIFHSGASVKFEEKLKDAIMMNVRGTREMLMLAKNIVNLKSFVYVSTAYSNYDVDFIEERVYPCEYEPNKVIELCENNEETSMETTILKAYPNTYIFSKKIAEKLTCNFQDDLPLCIVRPSIISPASRDPYPGWVDSKKGPMGFLIGAGTGFIRAAQGNCWNLVDILPVDYAANAIIAAGVNVGQHKISKCPVYNLSTSCDAPISWNQIIEGHREIILQNPFSHMLWYPGGSMYNNYFCYLIFFILFQLIPACFCDLFLFIKEQRVWFVRAQLKTFKEMNLFSYFVRKNWRWDCTNTTRLYNKLKISERFTFNFRTHCLDLRKYLKDWHYGTRKYLLCIKEKASEDDLRQLMLFYYLDLFVKIIFYSYIGYKLINYFGYYQSIPFLHVGTCTACSNVKNEFQQILFKMD